MVKISAISEGDSISQAEDCRNFSQPFFVVLQLSIGIFVCKQCDVNFSLVESTSKVIKERIKIYSKFGLIYVRSFSSLEYGENYFHKCICSYFAHSYSILKPHKKLIMSLL